MSDTVQGSFCKRSCHEKRVDISLSDILFVEMSPAVDSEIHFTCAVEQCCSTWEYFDDISEYIIQYHHYHTCLATNLIVLFVVYAKDIDTRVCSDVIDSESHCGYDLAVEYSCVKGEQHKKMKIS